MDILDTKKRDYVTPKITERGSIEQITQGWGELGTGDLIFHRSNGKWGTQDGCYINGSPLCEFGS